MLNDWLWGLTTNKINHELVRGQIHQPAEAKIHEFGAQSLGNTGAVAVPQCRHGRPSTKDHSGTVIFGAILGPSNFTKSAQV